MPLPIPREQALAAFYSAERRAGACPVVACERMSFFADRLDDAQLQHDLEIIKFCIERRT